MTQRNHTIPRSHSEFIDRAVSVLAKDPRIVGIAAAGSYADGQMDEFSDVDLVVAVAPEALASILVERQRIAAQIGPLLVAFTGEHVGEPRLLICLYGPPPLHVDLKFIEVQDAATRVDDPVVLWERGTALTDAMRGGTAQYPAPNPQWLEDRFWVWVHNSAVKIARGELFEANECLSFLRVNALSPMGLLQLGKRPSGVRRIEVVAPELARALEGTVAELNVKSLLRALSAAVAIYRRLRESERQPLQYHQEAEAVAVAYLDELTRKHDAT